MDLICYHSFINKSEAKKGVNMKDVLVKARTLASGKTVYEYRFEIASINGKRKWKTKSGFKTKTEAKQAGKLAQQTYENIGASNRAF